MIRKFCLYYYIYLLNYATKDLTSTGRMTSYLQGFFTTPLPNQFFMLLYQYVKELKCN